MHALRLIQIHGQPALLLTNAARQKGIVEVARVKDAVAATVGRVFSSRGPASPSPLIFLDSVLPMGAGDPRASLPNGDFAGIAITRDFVLLARDAQGRFPLYYHLDPGGRVTAASTSLQDVTQTGALNPAYFCSYLLAPDASQQHLRITPFLDAKRVLPGEVVTLSHDGYIRTRWTSLRGGVREPGPGCGQRGQGDRPGALRAALMQAVENRMSNVTGCHLSGGLDSSSVALLAALRIATRPASAGRGLVLVSAIYSTGEVAGERPYIFDAVTRVKEILPATRSILIPADDLLDFGDFRRTAQLTDEPYVYAHSPLMERLASVAVAAGCDSLLTGCGGDSVMDTTPLSLHTLIKGRRLIAAMKEGMRWAEAQDTSLRRVLTESVIRPVAPIWVERAARRGIPANSIRSLGQFVRPPWVKRDFARRQAYYRAAKQEASFRFGKEPRENRLTSATFITAPDPVAWWHAEQDGLILGHPFLDREVIDLMRGCPPCPDEGGDVPKGILRLALRDLLPASVLNRTRKVSFGAVYARGLHRHVDELIDACRSACHPLATEMFDTEVLAEALREAALGSGNAIAYARLNSSLAVLLWLDGPKTKPNRDLGSASNHETWDSYHPLQL